MDPVLIVEDEPKNQKILQTICKKLGHETMVAENGQVALDMLDCNTFSLYIVDLMMPVMDGRTFIRHLKKRCPGAVILVQTALDSTKTIIEIMKLGVFDYIIKPIDISLFEKTFNKAIEYHQLKADEEDRLRRFREELAVVREIQASLKPDFQDVNGFDIAHAVLPAEELSGDFLDGYRTGGTQHQIILCDVSGHGIASSYVGTEIRRMFRMSSLNGSMPSRIIQHVNNTILDELTSSRYLSSVAICQLDAGSGTVTYSSGGHPPSLLYRAEAGVCDSLRPRGPILGFVPDAVYEDLTIAMQKNDCLLLYTDGITEAFSEKGDAMFKENRLREAFLDHRDCSSLDIIYSILDTVYRFTNFCQQADDMTLICIKKL